MSEQTTHLNNPNALQKLFVIATLSAVALTGCSSESGEQGDSSRLQKSDTTRVDSLAGAVATTNNIWQTAQSPASAESSPSKLPSFVAKELTTAIAARNLQDKLTLPYPLYGSSLSKVITAKEAVNAVSDSELKQVATDYFESDIVDRVLSGVRFDDIEQKEANTFLTLVDPVLADQLRPTLEALDVSNAVITNYASAKRIRDDASDITDPALRQSAEDYASILENGTQYDADGRKLRQQLTDEESFSTELDAYRKRTDDAQLKFFDLAFGDALDAAVQKGIAKHNALVTPQTMEPLPKLSNPGKLIDLQDVVGTKKIHDIISDTQLDEFAELYVEDGKLTFHVNQDANLSDTARAQLERLTKDAEPLLEAAFANGDLAAVRFIVDTDFNPYFTPVAHEIHMILPTIDKMSEEQFRSALVHEITHALVEAAYGRAANVSPEEAELVKGACTAINTEAYTQLTSELKLVSQNLDSLIIRAAGPYKTAFEALKKAVDEDKLATITDKNKYEENSAAIIQRNLKDTNCNQDNFASMMVDVMYAQGVEKPIDTYQSMQESYKDDTDFTALVGQWNNAINVYSVFSKFNESKFVETEAYIKEYIGHSRDNSTELMATIVDVSLTDPEELKIVIAGMSPSQKAVSKQGIIAAYTIVGNRHPSLAPFLQEWQKQYEAL